MSGKPHVPLSSGESAAVCQEPDGRRQRAERSREQILEALLALIAEGDMSPSAAAVAERANVSLRTVFRHFEEIDSLYAEMNERVAARILPILTRPYTSGDWRGRLREMIARRAEMYEFMMPYRISGGLRRYQSAFIRENQRRTQLMEKERLAAILPRAILADRNLFLALDVAAGFDTWRRLREDRGANPKEAEACVAAMIERLIEGVS